MIVHAFVCTTSTSLQIRVYLLRLKTRATPLRRRAADLAQVISGLLCSDLTTVSIICFVNLKFELLSICLLMRLIDVMCSVVYAVAGAAVVVGNLVSVMSKI